MFVVALIAMLLTAAAGQTCPCNDSPPDSAFTCTDQLSFGQCGADFMSGYCECVCGVCAYEDDTSGMMMMTPTAPMTEPVMMTMEEGPAPELTPKQLEKQAAKEAEKEAKKAAKAAEKAAAKAAEKEAKKAARQAERQAAKEAENA